MTNEIKSIKPKQILIQKNFVLILVQSFFIVNNNSIMKIINGILVIAFIAFAIVQFNDPDSMAWVSIYLVVAGLALLTFFNLRSVLLYKVILFALVAWMITLIPATYDAFVHYDPTLTPDPSITHTADPQTEVMKEVGGLAVSFIAVLVLRWQAHKLGIK